MNVLQSLVERLRPLVGLKGWDYCVLWKLRDDRSCFEWMGCCCGGAESNERGEEQLFPVSPIGPCRDTMFQHPRTKSCDFLSELPSSMSLDSGIHTQALISSQPKWMNFSNISDPNISEVREDEQTVEFVMAQCNHPWDQEAMIDFPADQSLINHREIEAPPNGYDSKSNTTHFQHWLPPPIDNPNLAWDVSPTPNAFAPDGTNTTLRNPLFFDGSTDSFLSDKAPVGIDPAFPDIVSLHQSLRNTLPNLPHPSIAESSVTKDLGHHDKEFIKHELGRGDSVSDCSDQVEDDDDHKALGRSGRKHQSKNLMAERNRRKKLNDRLYALRSLVPKITKMDRASILGDAIEFVKELQKQVKELQDELEEETPPPPEDDYDDEAKKSGIINNNSNINSQLETPQLKMVVSGGDGESQHGLQMEITDHGTRCSPGTKTGEQIKANHESDKTQQMEPQVEVSQVEGKGFFLKVLCEYRPGGFVRLMEAMNSLGLEVTNANVTTFRTLVLSVFKVQKRDDEVVQAHQVRDSLLEITRNPSGILMWADSGGNVAEINSGDSSSTEHNQQQQQQQSTSQQHHHTDTTTQAHHHINLHHLQHFIHA